MILRGILENSLGGFTCIRGFAKMGDLAKISHAETDFQRKKIIKQESLIVKFLKDRNIFSSLKLFCLLV